MGGTELHFSILGSACWRSDVASSEALTTPASLRRRISPASQQALNAAWKLLPKGSARIIFSSRHGEFKRTLSLFESLAESGEVSPADFTLSVHHVLTGMLSIAQENRCGHIAVAGGTESFCYGFLEALVCLHENPTEPVLFIHCEEPLPAPFTEFEAPNQPTVAIALLLAAQNTDNHYSLQIQPGTKSAVVAHSHALDFLNFFDGNATELISYGERMAWRWNSYAKA